MQYPTSFFAFSRRPWIALASILAIASVVQACSDDNVTPVVPASDAGQTTDASTTTDADSGSLVEADGGGDASDTSDASPDAADSH